MSFATPAEQAKALKQLAGDERAFQRRIEQYARLRGWMAYSIPDSRRATERGYPDLTLVHPGGPPGPREPRVAWAEMKTDDGPIRPEQRAWLSALQRAARIANQATGRELVGVFLWRPAVEERVLAYLDTGEWKEAA